MKNIFLITLRRILWVACPLLMIAISAAPEWPARIEMLEDSLFKDVLYKPAVAWKNTVERIPVFQHSVEKEIDNTSLEQNINVKPTVTLIANNPVFSQKSTVINLNEPVKIEKKLELASSNLIPADKDEKKIAYNKPKFILAVGDSLMSEVSQGLRSGLSKDIKVKDIHKSSTGLTNIDYYDWPETAYKNVLNYKPDWVVIHLGGNDGQDIKSGNRFIRVTDPEWTDIYYQRANLLISKIRKANPNVNIVWLGLPAMRDNKFAAKMNIIRKAQEKAAKNNNIIYIDTVNDMGLGSSYQKQAKINGKTLTLRRTDGIHYTRDGGIVLADEIINYKELKW